MTKEEAKLVLDNARPQTKEIDRQFYDDEDLNNAIDMAIKLLEQRPSSDVMAIHTQGLAEGIRCAMCTNSIKSDRGCDGGCVVDEDMYKRVMETINNQIFSQPTSDDCERVLNRVMEYTYGMLTTEKVGLQHLIKSMIDELPPVTPKIPTSEDCVSRQAAQEAIESTIAKYIPSFIGYYEKIPLELALAIRDLPPATPIRKKGEWCKQNDDYFDWYECSECGYGSEGEMQYSSECDVRTKYCPNCGADMRLNEDV